MEAGIHELTAGYALDALDPDERRDYEAHLAECERCQEELASFWETTEALAVAATGPAPSAGLRDRILAEARAEGQVVVPLDVARRRSRVAPVLGAAAAIAAVVALAVGLWAAQVSGDLDDSRSALEGTREAVAVLADPTARYVALQEGEGRLVVAEDGRAALVLYESEPAPAGKAYALWILADGGEPAPAGLFQARDGWDVVALEGSVDSGDAVAVTVEDAGGVDAPTTDPIVTSDPV